MLAKIDEFIFWLVTTVTTALAAGVAWLVREVITNKEQVNLMKSEIAHRDKLRAEDREAMEEIRENVGTIMKAMIDNNGRR